MGKRKNERSRQKSRTKKETKRLLQRFLVVSCQSYFSLLDYICSSESYRARHRICCLFLLHNMVQRRTQMLQPLQECRADNSFSRYFFLSLKPARGSITAHIISFYVVHCAERQ